MVVIVASMCACVLFCNCVIRKLDRIHYKSSSNNSGPLCICATQFHYKFLHNANLCARVNKSNCTGIYWLFTCERMHHIHMHKSACIIIIVCVCMCVLEWPCCRDCIVRIIIKPRLTLQHRALLWWLLCISGAAIIHTHSQPNIHICIYI